jgi:hypothetical protein
VLRGGIYNDEFNTLRSSHRSHFSPFAGDYFYGFRVAAVPEPSGVTLLVIGAVGLMMKRRRG